MNSTQEYRKKNGLCLTCGELAVMGKTRCIGCLQVAAAKQKMYDDEKRNGDPDAYRDAKRKYMKKWSDKNREHVREYHRKWYEENLKMEPRPRANQKMVKWRGGYYTIPEISRMSGVSYKKLYHGIVHKDMTAEEVIRGWTI